MIKDNKDVIDDLPPESRVSVSSPFLKEKNSSPVSYAKTDKLISALYIVTDVMDKEEPLRLKLRTLGVDIISDLHSNFLIETAFLHKLNDKIDETMSFLGISETLNLISGMNANILMKEFLELRQSIKVLNPGGDLSIFFKEEERTPIQPTRIGVQKGNTLMKALSDRISGLSDKKITRNNPNNFDDLKKQRRAEIMAIVKLGPGGFTITDIKSRVQALPVGRQGSLASSSDKTLQRELLSMVKDSLLRREGEKRWSKYFLSSPL